MHVDGAQAETLTFRVSLGEADPAGRQSLQRHALEEDDARDDTAAGMRSLL